MQFQLLALATLLATTVAALPALHVPRVATSCNPNNIGEPCTVVDAAGLEVTGTCRGLYDTELGLIRIQGQLSSPTPLVSSEPTLKVQTTIEN